MLITKESYDRLSNEYQDMISNKRPYIVKKLEENRPFGCFNDSQTEYLQIIDEQTQIEKRISELSLILSQSQIYSDKTPRVDVNGNVIVGFGATVKIKDESDNIKKYKILSIYDSDINNGIISIEAPIIKEMIDLQVGDFFEFRNKEYEILSIEYI